jgi:zinc/manganese transport system substrate-binding protein
MRPVLLALVLASAAAPVMAQEKLPVVASFSILGDLVANVGGARVAATTLVGPDGDAHMYSASPADAKRVAEARVIFTNGLGFEGWMDRLVKAAGAKAPIVVATKDIRVRQRVAAQGHGHAGPDPHTWQSVANAKIYVINIRDGLIAADPAGRSEYEGNAAAYLGKLDSLENDIRSAIAGIPAARRKVITSHDAFGYFQDAYGIDFIAPQGVSTESEASARDVARIIRQIKAQKIPAVFLENVSDARLARRIADETGAKIGGTLFSDALSKADGQGATYIDMMRHNLRQLAQALAD